MSTIFFAENASWRGESGIKNVRHNIYWTKSHSCLKKKPELFAAKICQCKFIALISIKLEGIQIAMHTKLKLLQSCTDPKKYETAQEKSTQQKLSFILKCLFNNVWHTSNPPQKSCTRFLFEEESPGWQCFLTILVWETHFFSSKRHEESCRSFP